MSVPSSLSLTADIPIMVVATIGGVFVAFGLILEKFAEELDERFLGGYKAHKTLDSYGWRILMLGIIMEIADAGWTAHEIIKNNPNNFPITTVLAHAVVIVRSSDRDSQFANLPGVMMAPNANMTIKNRAFDNDPQFTAQLQLTQYKQFATNRWKAVLFPPDGHVNSISPSGNGELRYDIVFNDNSTLLFNRTALTPKQLDTVFIGVPFIWGLPSNSPFEVVTGDVVLTVNSIDKEFFIPAQTNDGGLITSVHSGKNFVPISFR